MCGGGGNQASRAAKEAETERQAQVERSTSAIDRAFKGRASQLGDFTEALRGEFRSQAEEQKSDADRRLKFSLARGGLTGGSAAADAGVDLGEEFQKGLLKGESRVQGAVADLGSADEASRRQLIALAQSGAGATTLTQQAVNALRANIGGARATGLSEDVGDIFSNTRALFTKQEEAAARRRGLEEANIFADPFTRGT